MVVAPVFDFETVLRAHRAGELTGVWAPNAAREVVCDLVRAREAAADDFRRVRQQAFLPAAAQPRLHGGGHWTLARRCWLAGQKFEHAAQQIVFQEGIYAIEMPSSAGAASRSNSPLSCRSGPWRQPWRLTKRCAALRFSSP